MNIVIVGHVDHGKSTIIGRLLADTQSLPKGKLEQVQKLCEANSKPFEYAFFLDALKDERTQGITIDAARVFFRTEKRNYLILDAPGHIEFLKSMVTGASRAEAAFLVIDGHEGVMENSKRHAYMLSLLGVKQVAVVINKMDLLDYSEARFWEVVEEYGTFLKQINIRASQYIPVSGYYGENIKNRSSFLGWYSGPTLIEVLDGFEEDRSLQNKPFRMPIQDVYKFTSQGDQRRIIAGTVESGEARVGDEIVFFPSGKKAQIKTLEGFPEFREDRLLPNCASGFTLSEEIYIHRGEVAVRADQVSPTVGRRFRASIFWLGRKPLQKNRDYALKIGTSRSIARIEEINSILDSATLALQKEALAIERNQVAEVTICLNRPIAYDLDQLTPATSRFVLVDEYEISGGGIIRESLTDSLEIEPIHRKYGQNSLLIAMIGEDLKSIEEQVRHLEAELLKWGRVVYHLEHEDQEKQIEYSRLLMDAGMLVLTTLGSSETSRLKKFKNVFSRKLHVIWMEDQIQDEQLIANDLIDWKIEAENNQSLFTYVHELSMS